MAGTDEDDHEEYRLNLGTQEAQELLLKQMEDYFFGQGAAPLPGYIAPKSSNSVT